jgi:hypothetical protein
MFPGIVCLYCLSLAETRNSRQSQKVAASGHEFGHVYLDVIEELKSGFYFRKRRSLGPVSVLRLIGISLCFVPILVSAQTKKEASKPVSRYMRDMGILYLETVERLSQDCAKDRDCMRRWETTVSGLEDRISIELSDRKRPSGDIPFWDFLRTVKYARSTYVQMGGDQEKAWSRAYITCDAHAHTIALIGSYDGNNDCETAIRTATQQ